MSVDSAGLLQIKLGNFVQELGYVSYVDHGPQLGLILGLVFGFALPVIVIVLLVVIFCVRRKHRAAAKHRQPIVRMSNLGGRTDRIRNSYQDAQDQAVPCASELRPLHPVPAASMSGRAEEPVKGNCELLRCH